MGRKQRTKLDVTPATLENGEDFKISPLALAMGIDPRKNEAQLKKLRQIIKKPEEQESSNISKERNSEESENKSFTLADKEAISLRPTNNRRRREAKPIILEVDATTARIPGLPPPNTNSPVMLNTNNISSSSISSQGEVVEVL